MTDQLDATPTWSGLLPVLVEQAAGSTGSSPEASSTAWAELRRMASIADGVVDATSDDHNPWRSLGGLAKRLRDEDAEWISAEVRRLNND
tara:strand:+ start:154 stop:423 length:270 start_codon:yes stop_codon:yes gene_type:complete